MNFTNLKNKNIFSVNTANLLDLNLLRSKNKDDHECFFGSCVESYTSFFFRKNLHFFFNFLFQMYKDQVFASFSKLTCLLGDDHCFFFLYPCLVNQTSDKLTSLILCSHLFNLHYSDPDHNPEDVIEDFYKEFQSTSHDIWQVQPSIHACIVNPFDKLVLTFENLHKADRFCVSLFLVILRNLVRSRKMLGFRVLNHIFKKYKKACIYLSKIFVREILKALNDELRDLSKSVVCETFCLVLTLAYLDDRESHTDPLIVDAVRSCAVLSSEFDEGKRFLFDFKNFKNFQVFVPGDLTLNTLVLRDYQLEGIKWLNFLWKYELNGILCDDMGLGKTLQSLITVSLQIVEAFKYQIPGNAKDLDGFIQEIVRYSASNQSTYLKVLRDNIAVVVCPNNLVYHWQKECASRIHKTVLHPVIVDASVLKLYDKLSDYLEQCDPQNTPNLLIIGYSALIKNQAFFDAPLGFVVLDEAHMIKNEKTQLAKAMKSLKSKRKLGLTGTPIQNNILELWSIFDFVMPGYLGQKKDFRKDHRTLMNMNMMSLELNKMRLTTLQRRKLEFLHAKVLPFIMRREKKDVLKDLPPKIIQDQQCLMSDAQLKFYNLFESNEKSILETEVDVEVGVNTISKDFSEELKKTQVTQKNAKQQILTTLNNLRKIVNHPFLMGSNPMYTDLVKKLRQSIPKREKVLPFYLGGKFRGLRSILNSLNYEEENIFSCQNNPNKIIIFSRFRDCCRMIVDYFAAAFPFVRVIYLSHELSIKERSQLVETFRVDNTYKVIVLTTRIGGLGLNLSSANIVVMFDHDFNPMNDLQAMDRAHRIGQKKCVNVFRLVTKGNVVTRRLARGENHGDSEIQNVGGQHGDQLQEFDHL